MDRFNADREARIVAGLSRSLGAPRVSVGAAAGSAAEVRITVAWDLSWYQWGVDTNDENRPVRLISQGREISELDGAAQHWNASAGQGARLQLGADPAGVQAPRKPSSR